MNPKESYKDGVDRGKEVHPGSGSSWETSDKPKPKTIKNEVEYSDQNKEFAHLHVHTDASLRDGLGTVPRLLQHAKGMGFEKIAMTDHGTLANAITFSIEAKIAGLKPLFGMEGYVVFDDTIGHITLLADGAQGWNSLLNLNNLAHKTDYRQPAFHIDDLVAYQKGLVCLTGCIASPFQRLPFEEAYRLGVKLKTAFGYRLFAELMFIGDSLAWERPLRLASRLGLQTVITNDVHFPYKNDSAIHPVLTKMKSGFDYDSSELYLKSYDQLLLQATRYDLPKKDVMESLKRAEVIARKLDTVNLEREPRLPSADTTKDLRNIAIGSDRGHLISRPDYSSRFHYEMDIIQKMHYEDYFLILNDIIWRAKEDGVKVGPGRGSGAGSLVLYILGITDVDPIKHGLQFERFLNPERTGMPDVDVDIDSENRQKVLDYASEKYGAVPISTYSRYSHKSLTRDLGKMYRVDKKLVDQAADGGDKSEAFNKIAFENPQFIQAYEAFMGQIRHKGKHAGGIIITDTPMPIERIGDGLAAAWTEGRKNELSHAGIVKFDLLGLSVLSALRRLEEKVEVKPPKPHIGRMEFQIFRDGNLSGIFQFSGSEGIRKLTMELAPNSFPDLVAINALYRPGAIDAGSTELYAEWKKSPREVPDYIADILEETYGAIVYQEQVMAIYQRTVKGSLGEADLARQIISKAKPDDGSWLEKMYDLRAEFLNGAMRQGLAYSDAVNLWKELETHSRYSFNKSHSTAYAMISWQCAWWKFNYPAQFYAAMLNVDSQNEQAYIIDMVKSGIVIGPPHVNKSSNEWEASDEGVVSMPLSAIKFLGKAGVDILIEQRETAGGKFRDLEHFMKLVPKKFVRARAREGLLSLGGFKGLFDEPKTTEEIKNILDIKKYPSHMMKKRDRQLRYLGVIIPDRKMLEKFEKLSTEGWTCGIIKSMDSRTSRFGPYVVYRLSPTGVFWSRDVKDLEKGQVVAVRISDKNGKAQKIEIL